MHPGCCDLSICAHFEVYEICVFVESLAGQNAQSKKMGGIAVAGEKACAASFFTCDGYLHPARWWDEISLNSKKKVRS
jgi:hypothetical protein